MAKTAFSRSDVVALAARMSWFDQAKDGQHALGVARALSASTALSRLPSSPVAAKVMREVGISSQKISDAYGAALAQTTARR